MIANKIHKNREEILNFCDKHKNIYLYGAGQVADLMLRYLGEENIEIEGIIVSDGHKTMDVLKGHKVSELSEMSLNSDDGVILSVGGVEKQDQLKNLLLERGLKKPQIFCQNFYGIMPVRDIHYDCLLSGKLEDDVSPHGFFSECKELDQIGANYNTDKCNILHNYLVKYEFFLRSLKNKSFNLLELGVFNGASLKMWEEYFPEANIYGVDIDERCREYEGGRRNVLIMDLGDVNNFDGLKRISPSVIIDDASHIWSHQIKALFYLFPILPSGGIFIMEDLGTSFSAYQECLYGDSSVSTYEICSQLANIVCGQEIMKQSEVSAVMWSLKDEMEDLAMQMEMISFIHGSCIMIKK